MAQQTSSHYIKRDKPPNRHRRHRKSLKKSSTFKKYNGQGR